MASHIRDCSYMKGNLWGTQGLTSLHPTWRLVWSIRHAEKSSATWWKWDTEVWCLNEEQEWNHQRTHLVTESNLCYIRCGKWKWEGAWIFQHAAFLSFLFITDENQFLPKMEIAVAAMFTHTPEVFVPAVLLVGGGTESGVLRNTAFKNTHQISVELFVICVVHEIRTKSVSVSALNMQQNWGGGMWITELMWVTQEALTSWIKHGRKIREKKKNPSTTFI